MALGADLGREQPERRIRRSFNVVHAVAVDTGRYVRVTFPEQGCTMHALGVGVVDSGMAALAGLRDAGARCGRILHVVSPVAVGTNRRLDIAIFQGFGVYAILGGLVFIVVAAAASRVKFDRYFPAGLSFQLGVGIFADVGMALDAGVAFFAVNRMSVFLAIDRQVQQLAGWQRVKLVGFSMAGETGFIVHTLPRRALRWEICLPSRGGLGGNRQHP